MAHQSDSTDIRPRAVITGASSGIGAATAAQLADAGFDLLLGARRVERLDDLAGKIRADHPNCEVIVRHLDVTDPGSVITFCADLDRADVLVNNAGGAIGTDSIAESVDADWQAMFDMNVLGVLRVTRGLLPLLRSSACATVVTIGSIAAVEPYLGGGGYNAAKHAVRALTRVLRLELLGEPVRVCEIDPGMVETEFSINRFGGDTDRAAAVYDGLTPLSADDVADAVTWVATRPAHVNVDSMLLLARDQTSAQRVHRTAAV
ncbi:MULTISPECIES: SDR family NAD(P)-dependent oxidoreductase [Gordonia]|uniref:SDR family NAD(P)-dependent oxidoreductase n=1 Tax=Gordonia oleivorans TaxID=3156618 RepID=UPI0032B59BB7